MAVCTVKEPRQVLNVAVGLEAAAAKDRESAGASSGLRRRWHETEVSIVGGEKLPCVLHATFRHHELAVGQNGR